MKSELASSYAMATRRDDEKFETDPSDEVWLMFVRNRATKVLLQPDLGCGFETILSIALARGMTPWK